MLIYNCLIIGIPTLVAAMVIFSKSKSGEFETNYDNKTTEVKNDGFEDYVFHNFMENKIK